MYTLGPEPYEQLYVYVYTGAQTTVHIYTAVIS